MSTQIAITKLAGDWSKCRRARLSPAILSLMLFALTQGGCSTNGQTSHSTSSATQTVAATATAQSQSVQLTLVIQQQGSVVDHALRLIATATISNRTADSIGLLRYYVVPSPFMIVYAINSTSGVVLWDNRTADSPYFVNPVDVARVAPGGVQTWTSTLDLSHDNGFTPHLTCVVSATIQWHKGPVPTDYYSRTIQKAQAKVTVIIK